VPQIQFLSATVNQYIALQISFFNSSLLLKPEVSMQGHKKRTCFSSWTAFKLHFKRDICRIAYCGFANIQSQLSGQEEKNYIGSGTLPISIKEKEPP